MMTRTELLTNPKFLEQLELRAEGNLLHFVGAGGYTVTHEFPTGNDRFLWCNGWKNRQWVVEGGIAYKGARMRAEYDKARAAYLEVVGNSPTSTNPEPPQSPQPPRDPWEGVRIHPQDKEAGSRADRYDPLMEHEQEARAAYIRARLKANEDAGRKVDIGGPKRQPVVVDNGWD